MRLGTNGLEHFQAVHLGQHQIENHQIWVEFGEFFDGGHAVTRREESKALVFQRLAVKTLQERIIIHQQDVLFLILIVHVRNPYCPESKPDKALAIEISPACPPDI